MKNVEREKSDFKHLKLFFYLIPILGFFPSLWTLYLAGKSNRRETGASSDQQLAISRLSVTLAGSWLVGYLLLGIGAETSEFLTLRFLMLNTLLTSGYFLVSIWLIVRLASGKSAYLPGFSSLAKRVGKHLS